jgi:hypothetical protein
MQVEIAICPWKLWLNFWAVVFKCSIFELSLCHPKILSNIPVYVILFLLPPRYWQQEGGVLMESVLAFIVAVAAGVACHYIIKWLDGDD